jgi:hypothetical protein
MKLAVKKIDDPLEAGQIWCSPQLAFAKMFAEIWLRVTALRGPPKDIGGEFEIPAPSGSRRLNGSQN